MTRFSRYFDTVNYTESDFAEVQNRLLPEGVIRGVGGELQVTMPGGMIARVATGEGMIQGFWFKNDAAYDITVPANNSGSVRTDAVFLTLDRTGNIVSLSVATNNPAPTRVLGGAWQLLLATITVPNNAAALPPEAVTDQRAGANCGYTGGGGAPDGNASSPGMAFSGRPSTGWWRDTPAGVTGGVRLSINAIPYYFLDYYGLSVATGAVVPGGYSFHVHGGYWLHSSTDAPIQWMMGNNIAPASQTKRAIFGLGTAASQFMGGSGDLNILTDGTAAGSIIFGTNYARRMTIAVTTGNTIVGPVGTTAPTGPGKFNVIQTAHGANSGIKLFHANQQHHMDFFQDPAANVYMQNVDNVGTRAPNSVIFAVNTGYLTIGVNPDSLAKITAVQASSAADQGFGLRLAGGYYRAYLVDEGGCVQTTATTAVRLWHSINAFTPNQGDVTSLGHPSYRWSDVRAVRATIGCADIAGSLDPIGPDAYHLGNVNRWHTLRVYVISVGSSITVPFLYVDQAGGSPGYGLRFVYGAATSYIYSDGANLNIWGHGTTARAHVMLVGNQAVFRPAGEQGCDLGQNGGRWAALWCNAINANGVVTSLGLNTQNNAISGGHITCYSVNTQNNNVAVGSGNVTAGSLNISGNAYTGFHQVSGDLFPTSGGGGNIGNGSNLWGAIWCTAGYKTGGGSWSSISDDRTKVMEAFRPYESGLDVILKLTPTWYTFNGLYGSPAGAEYVGLRATVVKDVAPDLVSTIPVRAHADREDEPEEDILTLDPSNIMYMLVNATQELHARIEALEAALRERMN
jgi:hypothetical protein